MRGEFLYICAMATTCWHYSGPPPQKALLSCGHEGDPRGRHLFNEGQAGGLEKGLCTLRVLKYMCACTGRARRRAGRRGGGGVGSRQLLGEIQLE